MCYFTPNHRNLLSLRKEQFAKMQSRRPQVHRPSLLVSYGLIAGLAVAAAASGCAGGGYVSAPQGSSTEGSALRLESEGKNALPAAWKRGPTRYHSVRPQTGSQIILYEDDAPDQFAGVLIFSASTPHILTGAISPFNTQRAPGSIAVDSNANIYVPYYNGNSDEICGNTLGVAVFMPGYNGRPYTVTCFYAPLGSYNEVPGVAVSSTGQWAMLMQASGTLPPGVAVYQNGSSTPCKTVFAPYSGTNGAAAFDGQGDLFITGTVTKGSSVFEMKGGCKAKQIVQLALKDLTYATSVAVDRKGNLVVDDSPSSGGPAILRIYPPGSTSPSKSVQLADSNAGGASFSTNGLDLWFAQVLGAQQFAYPLRRQGEHANGHIWIGPVTATSYYPAEAPGAY